MDPNSSTTAAQHRARNYWFEDGLPTLVGGFGCVLYGLSLLFDHSLLGLLIVVLYGVILLRSRPIIEWLKTRLTYPRTGYVTPPFSPREELTPLVGRATLWPQPYPVLIAATASVQQGRKKRMILVLVMLVAAVLGTMFIASPWIYAAAGLDVALALWVMNGKDLRLSWIAIGGLPLIGLYMASLPPRGLTPAHRLGYFLAASGLLIAADGAVALVRYLWRNPMQSVSAE